MCDCVHVVFLLHSEHCASLCVQILVCVCVVRELDSPLRWYISALSLWLVWVQQSRFHFVCVCMCVFRRNVGGGFIAYFNFLQKTFSQNKNKRGDRRREMRKRKKSEKERKKRLWRSRKMARVMKREEIPEESFAGHARKEGSKGKGERGKWGKVGKLHDSTGERGKEGRKEKEWETETETDRKLMSSAPVWDRWEEGSKGEGERRRGGKRVEHTLI